MKTHTKFCVGGADANVGRAGNVNGQAEAEAVQDDYDGCCMSVWYIDDPDQARGRWLD